MSERQELKKEIEIAMEMVLERDERLAATLTALRALLEQCKRDAIAHRQESETIRCKRPESLRLATSCENTLAGVHEWFAHQLEAIVARLSPPEEPTT